MMLLQAGQLGLTRRGSIWTDALPPDMVAGATLWIDGTDSTTLFGETHMEGPLVTTDGAVIASAQNKVNPSTYVNTGSGNDRVRLKANSAGTKSAIHVLPGLSDGINPGMSSAIGLDSLVSAGNKLLVAAMKVHSAPATSTPIGSAPLLGGDGLSFGLYAYEDGDPTSFLFYGALWNTGGSLWYVETRLLRDAYAVVTLQHASNQLRIRINGGGWITTACPSADVFGNFVVGYAPDYTAQEFEVAHAATASSAQTAGGVSAVERWIANDLGITPWW